jgi:hypothetical protein
MYTYNGKIKEYEMAEHVARMEENRNAYMLLMGEPEGKRLLAESVGGWIILRWMLQR